MNPVSLIHSGQRVFVHGGAATPNYLLGALLEESDRLRDVELIHLHTEGPARYADPEFTGHFKVANLFVGANMRKALDGSRIDYLPCFLSEIPQLFRSGRRPIDVAILNLSPPNAHGFCSLGVSVDVARAAFDAADVVIAQINAAMPRVHGDTYIHINDLDAYVEVDEPLPESHPRPLTDEDRAIGRYVASLIEDGSCLQVGIGSMPDAVLVELAGHRNLGLHSEMWSDGVLHLLKLGVIDNSQKKNHAGKCVSSFVIGSKRVYDFLHDNPSTIQLGSDIVNDPGVIRQNDNMVAINSAVEVDLTGQVCADSIGPNIISGVGGQMDFMRGASLSRGGKPIIAIRSRTNSGRSRITAQLQSGAGVVTTRAHVHHVITEYGVADLYGKTLGERARLLIGLAHPEDRERLEREWFTQFRK